MASFCSLLLVCLVLAVSPISITAADPDPLQDFCVADTSSSAIFMNGLPCLNPTKVTGNHFMTSALNAPAVNVFNATLTTALNLPGMNTLGVSMLRGDAPPGGYVTPHVHPRATEMVFVVKGKLNAGFVDTSNKLFSANLEAGDVFVFPRGLVHYLINIGTTPSTAIASFNSQNPGFVLIAPATFAANPAIPTEVLSKAFNITSMEVEKIRAGLGGK